MVTWGGRSWPEKYVIDGIQKAETHYDTLGLKPDAVDSELKRTREQLSSSLQSVPGAEAALKKVEDAFAVLIDDLERRIYDHELYRLGRQLKDPSTGRVLKAPPGYVPEKKKGTTIDRSAASTALSNAALADDDMSSNRRAREDLEKSAELHRVREQLLKERCVRHSNHRWNRNADGPLRSDRALTGLQRKSAQPSGSWRSLT